MAVLRNRKTTTTMIYKWLAARNFVYSNDDGYFIGLIKINLTWAPPAATTTFQNKFRNIL
jgi:hypothetical protein